MEPILCQAGLESVGHLLDWLPNIVRDHGLPYFWPMPGRRDKFLPSLKALVQSEHKQSQLVFEPSSLIPFPGRSPFDYSVSPYRTILTPIWHFGMSLQIGNFAYCFFNLATRVWKFSQDWVVHQFFKFPILLYWAPRISKGKNVDRRICQRLFVFTKWISYL